MDAMDTYDGFVHQLLSTSSSDTALHFGSMSALWGGSSLVFGDDETSASAPHDEAHSLLQAIAQQPMQRTDHQDLYRLRAIAGFHDREAGLHNLHTAFAPLKHSALARRMPSIRLSDALMLGPRTRLELGVLVATHLLFPLPSKLFREALAIALLSDGGGSDANWIDDVALVSALRRQALNELPAATPSSHAEQVGHHGNEHYGIRRARP